MAEVSVDDVIRHLPSGAHRLWYRPDVCVHYPAARNLLAWRGTEVVGLWLVPTRQSDGQTGIREYRLLPYSAPWIARSTNVKRRHVAQALFDFVKSQFHMLSLPLEPGFADAAIMQQHGALLEWRHTHMLRAGWLAGGQSGKLGNRIRRAAKECTVTTSMAGESFQFGRAVVGENSIGMAQRSAMARKLLAQAEGFVIEATIDHVVVGQALVLIDRDRGYLFHAWSDSRSRRPGVSALLIHESLVELVRRGITELDLEGSVVEGVDRFFCGLEADIVPYPSVHWARSQRDFGDNTRFDVAMSTDREEC